jgi:uncharacterized membrane protein YccC
MDENHRFNALETQIAALHSLVASNFITLSKKADQIMSAISDAVAKVSTDLDALGTSLDNDSTAIQAAIAALQQPSPDVAAAVTALQALDTRVQGYSTTLDSNTQALNAAAGTPAPGTTPPPAPQQARK